MLWLNNALSAFHSERLRTARQPVRLRRPITLALFCVLVERYPVPLLAFAAPFVVAREKRADVALAIGLILATCFIYVLYTPFDDWSYLRFLLPAIALMVVLASAVTVQLVTYALTHLVRLKADTTETSAFSSRLRGSASKSPVVSGFSGPGSRRTVIPAAITAGLVIFCVRVADERLAFNLKFLEQRYRSAGLVVRDRLPENAVVLSVWDSGAVRFHGRKEALIWSGLDPAWLDRAVSWLDEHGHPPYILLESWEEPAFRSRFGNQSDIGKLDWPPKYEIDRTVRIFDPKDRARYDRGESVTTEYLWPMRD